MPVTIYDNNQARTTEYCHQVTTIAGINMKNHIEIFLICPPTCNRIKPKHYKSLFYKCKRIFRYLNKWKKQQRYCKTFGNPPPQSMFQTIELENKVKKSKRLLCEDGWIGFFHCTNGLSKDQHQIHQLMFSN